MFEDAWIIYLLFGLIAVIGIAVVLYHRSVGRIRSRGLRTYAERHDFAYRRVVRRYPSPAFTLFRSSRTSVLANHMQKTLPDALPGLGDVDIEIFGCLQVVQGNQYQQYSCALVMAGLELGGISVRREKAADRVASGLGAEDIDFEDSEFSRRFVVQASRKKDAYRVIGPRLMDCFLRHEGLSFETRGPYFLVFRQAPLDVWGVEELLAFVEDILSSLPRPLVNEERGRRGLPPAIDAGDAAKHHRP